MDYLDFDKSDRRKKGRRIIIKAVIWMLQIAFVVGLAYFIINFTLEKTTMLGSSMGETLQDADVIIVNKLMYRFTGPKRYDVIVFKQSGKEHSYYNIKRVIGLPGETIQIKEGVIYIDDEKLEEPILIELMNVAGLAESPLLLEKDEYFVLGDARNNSEDSRFANIGTVVKSDIIGKAWLKTEPNFGFISKFNLKPKQKVTNDENTEENDTEGNNAEENNTEGNDTEGNDTEENDTE